MAQYGGEQYQEEGYGRTGDHAYNTQGHNTGDHAYNTQGHNTGDHAYNTQGHINTGGMGTNIHSTTAGQGYEEGKHGGLLHRTGSGSSSSSESDGEGGRRKKKGVVEKIKEKLPGGDHGGSEYNTSTTAGSGGGYGYEGTEVHEKKGLMDKIKDKLPGGH